MSEACGRRRLAKLVFATGASGNLRGFLEEGVHASYNYRLTDPFVFHAAFLEEHLRSVSGSEKKTESFKEAAESKWKAYLELDHGSGMGRHDPYSDLRPYEKYAKALHVEPQHLWALDKANVLPDSDKTKNGLLEKEKNELLKKWDTLKLKEEHLNSINKVSDQARNAAERLTAWQNASEEQKKAAEELIEVASKGNLTNQDDDERVLRAIAEKTFGEASVPRYRPNFDYTKHDELREVYGGSKVAWALDRKKGEITDDLLECRAAKKALLDWKAEKAKEAKEKWCREHTSPELLQELARNTIVKVRGDESCWNTPDAQARLDEVEKNMSTFVKSAENASQRAKEAAERAEKATERAKDALQTARKAPLSVKKPEASDWRGTSSTHHHDIRTDAAAGSKAPSKQPDNGSGSTPKLQSGQENSSVQQQTPKSQTQTEERPQIIPPQIQHNRRRNNNNIHTGLNHVVSNEGVGRPNAGGMWMIQGPQNSINVQNSHMMVGFQNQNSYSSEQNQRLMLSPTPMNQYLGPQNFYPENGPKPNPAPAHSPIMVSPTRPFIRRQSPPPTGLVPTEQLKLNPANLHPPPPPPVFVNPFHIMHTEYRGSRRTSTLLGSLFRRTQMHNNQFRTYTHNNLVNRRFSMPNTNLWGKVHHGILHLDARACSKL